MGVRGLMVLLVNGSLEKGVSVLWRVLNSKTKSVSREKLIKTSLEKKKWLGKKEGNRGLVYFLDWFWLYA